jgi:hypothetical protein
MNVDGPAVIQKRFCYIVEMIQLMKSPGGQLARVGHCFQIVTHSAGYKVFGNATDTGLMTPSNAMP